jgi:hypothetical protein
MEPTRNRRLWTVGSSPVLSPDLSGLISPGVESDERRRKRNRIRERRKEEKEEENNRSVRERREEKKNEREV